MGEDSQEPQDARLPRHLRRFPYQATSDAERAEVIRDANTILIGIDAMIIGIVRKLMPKSASDADLDDVCQETRWHLVTYSLPRYDTRRNVKLSTFLHRCISTFTITVRRRWIRQRRLAPGPLIDVVAADTSSDRAVEAFADAICRCPESFGLKESQARAVRADVASRPGTERRDIAAALGYVMPGSLSVALQRARKHLVKLDIFGDPPG